MGDLISLLKERGFATLYSDHPDGVYVIDHDGRFVTVNRAFEVMAELEFADMIGATYVDMLAEEHRAEAREAFKRAMAGETVRLLSRSLAINGTEYYIDLTNVPLSDEEGNVVGVIGIVRDVSDFQEALARIESTSTAARFARDFAGIAGWSIDVATGELRFSDETLAMLDIVDAQHPTLEESLEFYEEPYRTRLREALRACIEEGRDIDLVAEVLNAVGRAVPVHVVGRAIYDVHGRVVRVDGILHDQTALLAHRAELDALEHRLVDSLNEIDVPMIGVDRAWHLNFVNTAGRRLVGLDGVDVSERTIWDLFPFLTDSSFEEALRGAMNDDVVRQATDYVEPYDRWFDAKVHPVRDGIIIYVHDVTDSEVVRRRAEALNQRAAFLAHAMDLASDAVVFRELSGEITYWNTAAERLYGWRFDEVVGRDPSTFLHRDAHEAEEMHQEVLSTGIWRGEVDQRTKDGRTVTVDTTWQVLSDDQGEPTGLFGILTDITDRKRDQERRIRNQRMESLGTLAGGIAHDLNNVLTPVLMSIDLLRARHDDASTIELVESMERSVRRGADLLRQVLTFARGVDGEREALSVEDLLSEVRRFCRETLPRNIDVTWTLDEHLWPVVGDATQLMQVLINLVTNARDAMPDGGTLAIEAETVVLDGVRARGAVTPLTGRFVHVSVTDSGVGMDAVTAAKAFEPFFTTKPLGEGTGLGLSTSRAIVRSHGGGLDVSSSPSSGTRVSVYLPASEEDIEPRVEHEGGSPTSKRVESARILLADDERPIAELLTMVLEAEGYEVFVAGDGETALDLATSHAPINLLVSDIHMPGLDGANLARRLRASAPGVKIVLMSGLPIDDAPYDESTGEFFTLLRKPFSVDDFLGAVHGALAP